MEGMFSAREASERSIPNSRNPPVRRTCQIGNVLAACGSTWACALKNFPGLQQGCYGCHLREHLARSVRAELTPVDVALEGTNKLAIPHVGIVRPSRSAEITCLLLAPEPFFVCPYPDMPGFAWPLQGCLPQPVRGCHQASSKGYGHLISSYTS